MGKKKKRKEEEDSELLLPTEEGQVICVVTEIIGANYIKVFCMDGKSRMTRIPGKLRRRMWINPKDVVLVGVWEFRDDRGDVLYRYSREEKKKLIELGYLDPKLLEFEEGEF
ncbi:MAG: translation initiation factor IF-1A [Desulfurococcales archaeon]|nr:translation initiation factor IF-1A [Desulfurococcales archaeon]RLG78239.1 MAG: translation initiation factor IF-1A [Thermoprotei archaeon]